MIKQEMVECILKTLGNYFVKILTVFILTSCLINLNTNSDEIFRIRKNFENNCSSSYKLNNYGYFNILNLLDDSCSSQFPPINHNYSFQFYATNNKINYNELANDLRNYISEVKSDNDSFNIYIYSNIFLNGGDLNKISLIIYKELELNKDYLAKKIFIYNIIRKEIKSPPPPTLNPKDNR